MARGLRLDIPSQIGTVYLTQDGLVTGLVCEAAWTDLLAHVEVPGETKRAITGKVSNWSYPRGTGSVADREVGRSITLVLTGAGWALFNLLRALAVVDTNHSITLYHRFRTYTGVAKFDRAQPLVAVDQDHHFVGSEALELTIRLNTVSGAWA